VKTNVFLSYGHNNFDNIAKAIEKDLIETNDFDVFFDLNCLDKGDWEALITAAIERCDFFVFFVSEKSISPTGYCLNELSRACELKKEIIPIVLDNSYVPLSITRLQRLFLSSALTADGEIINGVYSPVLERLLRILRREENLGFYNRDFDIANNLRVFNPYEIMAHVRHFAGREHIFYDFEKWVNDPHSLPVYLLEAAPGIGKSAICSMLTVVFPENVAAIHFCSFSNSEKNNVKNVIKNLACQLSYRNTDFLKNVTDSLKNAPSFDELDAKRIFEILILEPSSKTHFDKPQVLIVDALDEAVVSGRNDIAELILSYRDRLPQNIRFFCTTRPRNDVTIYFSGCHRLSIEEFGETNTKDLIKFYKDAFPDVDEQTLNVLLKKAHGSFLYAKTIIKGVLSGDLKLSDAEKFPDGIYSYYALWFDRIFTDGHVNYEDARKVLSLILVCSTAPTIDFLSEATGLDDVALKKITDALSDFFPVSDERVTPRHKSVADWLLNPDDCPARYRISKNAAYKILLEYIVAKRSGGRRWKRDIYVIKDYSVTLRALKKYDQLYELLIDEEYQHACVESAFFTLYEALIEYVSNLYFLYEEDEDYAFDVYESKCFIDVFSKYRMKIYNSGLFIQLKKCGFADYLKENDDKDFGLEFELGELHFYYISLSYPQAAEQIKRIIKNHPPELMDVNPRSELKRMMMLVYRKLVEFGKLEEIGNSTIADARDADNKFEESLAYLTLSKVFCRELRKKECYDACDMAVKILSEKVEEDEDISTKIGDHLFLAEDLRVYADACIWLKDYDKAKDLLKRAEAIYVGYNQYDRYYPRFLYTSLFYNISAKDDLAEAENLIAQVKTLLEKTNDDYDKAQLSLLTALMLLKRAHGDAQIISDAKSYAVDAVNKNKKLAVPLERLEAQTLYNIAAQMLGEEKKYADRFNQYTDVWIDYVEQYFLGILQ